MKAVSVHLRRLIVAHYFGIDVEEVTLSKEQSLTNLIRLTQDPYSNRGLDEEKYNAALIAAADDLKETVEKIVQFRVNQIAS
jgi:hypothetical protein